MSNKAAAPDAWDDDWEAQADNPQVKTAPIQPVKVSKAERRAKHAEQQRVLWDSAENPNRSYFLESQGVIPLKQEYKAPVQLLSRKPQGPKLAKRGDTVNGIATTNLDGDEDDSEEEARKKQQMDLERRTQQAKVEREEKQQKYAEARARIMGTNTGSASLTSSRESSQGRNERRRLAKGNNGQSGQPRSAAQSPTRNASTAKQLFDPEDMGRRLPRRQTPVLQPEAQPLRQPRGPDRSGRGGFGFNARRDVAGA